MSDWMVSVERKFSSYKDGKDAVGRCYNAPGCFKRKGIVSVGVCPDASEASINQGKRVFKMMPET